MRLPHVRRFQWLGLAVLLLIGATGTALAGNGQPDLDDVTASYSTDRVSVDTVTCAGADGDYLQLRVVTQGTQSSADPRLAGDIRRLIEALINVDTGDGIAVAFTSVRNAETGQRTARIFSIAVIDNGMQVKGFASGRLRGGGFILGTVSEVTDRETGHTEGTLGSDSPPVAIDPAVIFNGAFCEQPAAVFTAFLETV